MKEDDEDRRKSKKSEGGKKERFLYEVLRGQEFMQEIAQGNVPLRKRADQDRRIQLEIELGQLFIFMIIFMMIGEKTFRRIGKISFGFKY